MNRWKTKKKAKEAEAASARGPSTDSDPPPMPILKSSKTFRLGGKKAPEPERIPEFSLENALPSSDDFRTSLLMSGLSARFSMLREQDDPTSKIGKASDDSVLFPKRQSRLNDFGFQSHGLADIAEVSSIHSSIKPPFAFGRSDSYHDGYGTDDDTGSIMSRKKPIEGNNLFGGRQKIYKIPAGSPASTTNGTDSTSGKGMGGRALYGDDVSQSAFQKLREREREQEQRVGREEEVASRSNSPVLNGYNRKRETSSTTTSITRSSTAATSVTSQRTPSLNGSHAPVSPTGTKSRRMYESGLDQQLHEQQHSAMSRIDTLTRQRPLGAQSPPPSLSSPVAASIDRWERHPMAGKQSMPNLRAASPPLTVTPFSAFDFGVKPTNSDSKSFGATSPLSPPTSEYGDTPVLAVQPNDRGKATAMGTFSKPTTAYDENKYSQRQIQLHSTQETSPPRKQSPPRALGFRPQQQPPLQMPRNRADSNTTFASNRSRSNSSAQRNFLPHDRISESSSINHQTPVLEEPLSSSDKYPESPDRSSVSTADNLEQNHQPRFQTPLDIYRMHHQVPETSAERPPESQHPANRSKPFQLSPVQIQGPVQNDAFGVNGVKDSSMPISRSLILSKSLTIPQVEPPVDSPTLGGPTLGLISIRQHLRTDSNTSSIYSTMPSAGLVSRFPDHPDPMPMPPSEYASEGNPWNANNWDRGSDADYGAKEPENPPLSGRSANPTTPHLGDAVPSWEQDLDAHHVRSGSSETQKEREEFQNELASRRRQIKEHLRSFADTESQSAGPGPGADSSRDYNPVKTPALGLLKGKATRGSLVGKQRENGNQTKAMKMLGLGTPDNMNSSSSVKQPFQNNLWQKEEDEMLRGGPKALAMPQQTKAFRQARRDAQRDRERQLAERLHQNQRNPADANQPQRHGEIQSIQRIPSSDRFPPNIRTDPREPSRDRKPPPVTYSNRNDGSQDGGSRTASRSSRERSGSDASGRSKSRNGRYKDDLAKAMAEGTSNSHQTAFEDLEVPTTRFIPRSPGTPNTYQQSPMPSPMVGTPRSRTNSTLTPAGYFEHGQKSPLAQTPVEIDHTPRPAPAFSANPTPSLMQPSPSPSLVSTPTAPSSQTKASAPRKRSINKHDISEPKLISSTSRITTVDLPPGASLQNGIEPHSVPPIPPVNPRRRQTRAMFGFGRKDDSDDELHSLPAATQSTEEMSTFSADEGDNKPRMRHRLRKSTSEGGNLNARARQAAMSAPSPALPTSPFPPGGGSPPRPVEGGMF